jgi:hypothetical protein
MSCVPWDTRLIAKIITKRYRNVRQCAKIDEPRCAQSRAFVRSQTSDSFTLYRT